MALVVVIRKRCPFEVMFSSVARCVYGILNRLCVCFLNCCWLKRSDETVLLSDIMNRIVFVVLSFLSCLLHSIYQGLVLLYATQ